jgi:endonuclease YncB( thermonuclease family)
MTTTPPPSAPPIPPPGFTPKRRRRWPKRVGIGVGIWLGLSAIAAPFMPDEAETAEPAPVTTAAPTTTEVPTTIPAITTTADESAGVMPDVVGLDLQTAQDTIQAETELSWSDSRDATGQDRAQIVDSNWTVVGQTPAAGSPLNIGDTPMLDVVKQGEAADTEAPAPTTPPTVAPTTTVAPAAPVEPLPAALLPVVVNVIDGDTLDLDNGERVRLVGIDAPESGTCGADEATTKLTEMALGRQVILEVSDEDRDRYGRLLRYVIADGIDVGGGMLMYGVAVPRYNSTDGYGLHPREAEYFTLAQPPMTCAPPPTAAPTPAPAPVPAPAPASRSVSYPNCDAVRAAGADPISVGDPGWQSKFDRDGDGVGCES